MRAPLLILIALTACTTVSITVYRRAGAPEAPRDPHNFDVAAAVQLPRAPLLNRFDLFASIGRPVTARLYDFQDYFRPPDTSTPGFDPPPTWAHSRAEETAVADEIRSAFAKTAGPVQPTATSVSVPIISFIHLTDVQIREARAKLLDERQSKGLDRIVNSFEHDFMQELRIDVMFEALVQTFNVTASHAANNKSYWLMQPTFAIHTGDAIDSGLASEFEVFRSIMDSLRRYGPADAAGIQPEAPLPWLSAIGNHDVFTFGNFVPGASIRTSSLIDGGSSDLTHRWWWGAVGWIAQANWRLEPNINLAECAGCADHFLASSARGYGFLKQFIEVHRDPVPDTIGTTTTNYHGYDLEQDPQGQPRGYYKFEVKTAAGYIFRGIVINTDDFGNVSAKERGGEGGWVSKEQLDWLDRQLTTDVENRVIVVFGHHPLETIRIDGNRGTLAAHLLEASADEHLLAYVTGHTHNNALDFVTCNSKVLCKADSDVLDNTCSTRWRGFWQIQTASVIGFPQEGRMITLRKLSDRLGFLELMPIRHTFTLDGLTPFRRMLDQAERGAKRDYCRLSECIDGEPIRRDGAAGAVRLFVPLPPLKKATP